MRSDQRQVDITTLPDRFTSIHSLHHREFTGPLLDKTGQTEEVFAALAPGHCGPCLLIGFPRGSYRLLDHSRAGFTYLGEDFACCGIPGLGSLRCTQPLTTDIKVIALFQHDVLAILRSRRIAISLHEIVAALIFTRARVLSLRSCSPFILCFWHSIQSLVK